MMKPSHDRVSEVFLFACDLVAEKREAYLDEACGDDDAFRAQINAMLQSESAQPGGLSRASVQLNLKALLQEESLPKTIGPFTIKRKIGVGGMGIVYEAEQEKPTRSVALKVLRWVDDPKQLARFELEAEVLGWLRHPSIAHIYGSGQSELPAGPRPWIAMEFVDGAPIDQYVLEQTLDVPGILQLLERILEGIAHAHSKGVVHRDLKPANILVDQTGAPRIVDFGVARLATKETAAVQTQAGDVFGTLAYMSPEQVSQDPGAVDTQSDIYAMGVIAYELLSGKQPIVPDGASVTEAMRAIAMAKPASLKSHTNIPEDLNTIVHTAMAHDKIKRYATAGAFAEDIRRYLAKEVILARPPSALYQLRCFGRRNRLASLAMLASLVLLIGGGTLSTYLYLKEQNANVAKDMALTKADVALDKADKANLEAIKQATLAERGLAFYGNIIAQTNSGQMGRNVTLAELLHNASLAVPKLFHDSPLLQIQFLNTFSNAQVSAKRNDLALKDSELAVQLLEAHVSEKPVLASQTYMRYGTVLRELKRHEEALSFSKKAVALLVNHSDPEEAYIYAAASLGLASAYSNLGKHDASLEALQPAFDVLTYCDPPVYFPGRLLQAKAVALTGLDKATDAMTALREAITYTEEKAITVSPLAVELNYELAKHLIKNTEIDEAIAILAPLPAIGESLNGKNRQWIRILKLLKECYFSQGNHAKIVATLERAQESDAEPDTTTAFENFQLVYALGMAYMATEDFEKADVTLNAAIEIFKGTTNRYSHLARVNVYNNLSQVATKQGLKDLAIEYASKSCEAVDVPITPPQEPSAKGVAYRFLAFTYIDKKDWSHGAENLLRALEFNIELESDSDPQVVKNRETLATECQMALSHMKKPHEDFTKKLAEIVAKHGIQLGERKAK